MDFLTLLQANDLERIAQRVQLISHCYMLTRAPQIKQFIQNSTSIWKGFCPRKLSGKHISGGHILIRNWRYSLSSEVFSYNNNNNDNTTDRGLFSSVLLCLSLIINMGIRSAFHSIDCFFKLNQMVVSYKCKYLTIILRNRTEYRLIRSRRGRRPIRLKSDDIPRDWAG